jgi:hypothetical protein
MSILAPVAVAVTGIIIVYWTIVALEATLDGSIGSS